MITKIMISPLKIPTNTNSVNAWKDIYYINHCHLYILFVISSLNKPSLSWNVHVISAHTTNPGMCSTHSSRTRILLSTSTDISRSGSIIVISTRINTKMFVCKTVFSHFETELDTFWQKVAFCSHEGSNLFDRKLH